VSYREILAGRGFGLRDARPSIEIVQQIRDAKLEPVSEGCHPMCAQVEASHR
jgi:UDP-N-acetyl-2-amino-2-deoxyglucuronate dehydrogenase